jgi:hypothetical protein
LDIQKQLPVITAAKKKSVEDKKNRIVISSWLNFLLDLKTCKRIDLDNRDQP